MKRILIISLLVVFLISQLTVGIAHAAEPQPTTLVINSIDAYNNAINPNDQLHIVSFDIAWTSGNYTATQAFIFRFYKNGVEIAATTCYSYYNEGKSQGIVAFFFDADDANLPAWGSANLSVKLMENPSITWSGNITQTEETIWNSWNGNTLIGAKVRAVALELENVWSGVNLIAPVNGVNKLTSYGEDYFETAIPNLRSMASTLFTSNVNQPSFPTGNHSSTYGDTTMDRWVTSGNGTFDVTSAAVLFGTSRNWLMSGLWIIASIIMLCLMTYGVGKVNNTGVTSSVVLKPAMYLFGFMMIIGSFMGFMVLQVGLFCGIAGGIVLIFTILWRGAP